MGRWETELLAAFPPFLRSLSCREFLTPCLLPLGRVEVDKDSARRPSCKGCQIAVPQGISNEAIIQGLPNSGAWNLFLGRGRGGRETE